MFDDRLKNLRTQKNMNMKQVALELNMAYTTYVSYEKDEREPNSEVLVLLANYFDCSVDYLLGRTQNVKTLINNDEKDKINNSENSNDIKDTSLKNVFSLNDHEKKVITAYRQQPSMQEAVDRLLGVE